jgi:putative Mg2+ transporter-C (MgtC) family protein
MTIEVIILKLLLAIVLGGVIGVERQTREKPAGFRTNILICISSATMMILAQFFSSSGEVGASSSRVAAGVITGVGFLGAGTIIQSRGAIHGLTTASTIWAVAGLGLIIGGGYYVPAVIFTGLIVLTLVLFRRIEESFLRRAHRTYHLRIAARGDALEGLRKAAIETRLRIENLHLKKDDDSVSLSFTVSGPEDREQHLHAALKELGEIVELRID